MIMVAIKYIYNTHHLSNCTRRCTVWSSNARLRLKQKKKNYKTHVQRISKLQVYRFWNTTLVGRSTGIKNMWTFSSMDSTDIKSHPQKPLFRNTYYDSFSIDKIKPFLLNYIKSQQAQSCTDVYNKGRLKRNELIQYPNVFYIFVIKFLASKLHG